VFDALREQGWEVTDTGSGHYRAVPPDRTKKIVHFSQSAHRRALANTLADLRRSGFVYGRDESEDEPLGAAPLVVPGPEPGPLAVKMDEHLRVVSPAEAFPPVPNPRPKTTDELFLDLKESLTTAKLATELLHEASERLRQAHAEVERATHEKRLADEDLARKKGLFDAAFAVDAS